VHELGERAQYIVLETAGSNALDFHIAYYLGVLAAADPSAFFHIISNLISHNVQQAHVASLAG